MDSIGTKGRPMTVTYADIARELLHSGLGSPLPLPPYRKKPPPDGWTGAAAPYASSSDIEAWIESNPSGSTGLRLADELIGIDVDAYGGKQGAQTMTRLVAELGPLPRTVVITSRGFMSTGDPSGIRLYRVPPGAAASMGDIGGNVEVLRAQHRYAVVAGIHPDTGRPYCWHDGSTGETLTRIPLLSDIPALPDAWLEHLRSPRVNVVRTTRSSTAVPFAELSEVEAAEVRAYLDGFMRSETQLFAEAASWPEGRVDDHGRGWQKMVADLAYRLGAFLRAPWAPVEEEDCLAALRAVVPPAIAAAVNVGEEWARQGSRAEPAPMPAPRISLDEMAGSPRGTPDTATVVVSESDGRSGTGDVHSGQVRMAHRLASAYRGQLLHAHGLGWFHYDGIRWVEDHTGNAERAVLDVLEQSLIDSLRDESLRRDVGKCESAAGLSGVLQVARSLVEFACTADSLDQNPALLNTRSGTLDLDTLTVRPHDPADRITKVTRAAYDPAVSSPQWEKFLAQILPDAEERSYLQRVFGQALYGRVREHILPMLTGEGGNGKGVTYGTILHVLGTYGTTISPEMLLTKDRSTIPTEVMDLRGTRLAIASETNEGRKFDEAMLKRLTGGDLLKARRLYKDPVEFVPSHTIAYVTNKLPQVSADSPAIWRRIRVVPFDVIVPDEHRDLDLQRRLEDQADAVLTWLVAGYADYQQRGMAEPSKVLAATEGYRANSDPVRRFISETCFVSHTSSATSRELYSTWQRWAQGQKVEPLSEVGFGKELDRLGYEASRRAHGMVRKGLMPLSEEG